MSWSNSRNNGGLPCVCIATIPGLGSKSQALTGDFDASDLSSLGRPRAGVAENRVFVAPVAGPPTAENLSAEAKRAPHRASDRRMSRFGLVRVEDFSDRF